MPVLVLFNSLEEMGVVLNTVGVNASVDDGGRIVRWFDKEAAFGVLAGPWFEVFGSGHDHVPWTPAGGDPNSLSFHWSASGRSATKRITAGYRSLAVELECRGVDVTCTLEIAAGHGADVRELAAGVEVTTGRSVVRGEWSSARWTAHSAETGIRIVIPAGPSLRVGISVADGS